MSRAIPPLALETGVAVVNTSSSILSRTFRVAGIAVLLGTGLVMPTVTHAQESGACIDAEEAAFLSTINEYRTSQGLGPVAVSAALTDAAEFHSIDMARNGYFAHTAPDGTTAEQNIRNHGYTDPSFGENIVAGVEDAASAFDTWRNSAPHNENMLRAEFGAIGISRHYEANSAHGWYWTTDFGGSVENPATFCDGVAQTSSNRSGKRGVINDPDVNVRRGPSRSEAVAQTVDEGTTYTVIGDAQNGYVPVDVNGETLWVADEWIDVEGEAAAAPTASASVSETVNLRVAPDQNADVLDMIPRDTAIDLTGREANGFVEVSYNGETGWVNGAYVSGEIQAMMAVPSTPSGADMMYTIADVRILADATKDAAVLMVIPSGSSVTPTGNAMGGFLEVIVSGQTGWADAAYVQ